MSQDKLHKFMDFTMNAYGNMDLSMYGGKDII